MNQLLKSILWVALAVIIALLLYRYVIPSSEEVQKLKQEIHSTRALVDSLQHVNQNLLAANTVLQQAERLMRAQNDSLQEVSNVQKKRMAQLVRNARFFPGTPDSLYRELNRLADLPLAVCPE